MRVLHTYSRLGVLNCPSPGIHGSSTDRPSTMPISRHPDQPRFPPSLHLGETLFSGLISEEGWRILLVSTTCNIYIYTYKREREGERDVSYTSYRSIVRTWCSRPRDYLMGPRLRSGIKCNFEERSLASLTGLFIEFVGDEFIKKLKRELIIFLQVCVMCRSIFFFLMLSLILKGF